MMRDSDRYDRRVREKVERDKLYELPANRRLKYVALSVIGVGMALMIAMLIWMDDIGERTMLLMRGCAGVCAIVFVILCTILVFRVNKQHMNDRFKRRNR